MGEYAMNQGLNFSLEHRLSPQYYQRREMLAELRVPTLSEAKDNTGAYLSMILIQECHPELRQDFGLTPQLNGPRGELWTSPSDLLIGKVALKPPMTQKHIQALTHEGILELGASIERKFMNEMQVERQKVISDQEVFLQRMFEIDKKNLADEVKIEEKAKYEKQMEELRSHYDTKIAGLLYECGSQVERLIEHLQVETDSLHVLWQERLEIEIKETVDKIMEEFLQKLQMQENVLVETFNRRIRNLKMNHRFAMDLERTKCKEALLQMKHKLHCENISNLMYLLCKERKRCKSAKTNIEDKYQTQIRTYRRNIAAKNRKIRELLKTNNKKSRQIKVRERCLLEIIKQFQKFIYFALRATPTQGEFLLNINKLLKFELDDSCLEKEAPQVVEPAATTTSERSYDYQEDIEAFLQRTKEIEEEECAHTDDLPAFFFNDKVYVREEFRDLILSKEYSLWSPEVETVLKMFKESINKRSVTPLTGVKSHQSSVHFSEKEDANTLPAEGSITIEPLPLVPPTTFSIDSPPAPPKDSISEEDEKEIRRLSLGEPPTEKEKKSKKSAKGSKRSSIKSDDEFEVRKLPQRRQSRLSFTRDSVILHLSALEKKSLQQVAAKAAEEISRKEESLETSTERVKMARVEDTSTKTNEYDKVRVIKMASDETTNTSPDVCITNTEKGSASFDGESGKRMSKLLLATDSLEIIKSTMGLSCGGDEPKGKSQLSFSPNVVIESSDFQVHTPEKAKMKRPRIRKPNTSKPKYPAKVLGARTVKEHEMAVDDFSKARINSLVALMKENPSIIRMFTQCRQ